MSSPKKNTPVLPRKTIVRIGAHANVDERTVRGFLTGEKRTIPPVADAIRAAMRSFGLNPPTEGA